MKFIETIKSTLLNTKESVRRFPITIATSVLLTILLIYLQEVSPNISTELSEKLVRINMVVGLGIPLSLSIGLLGESFSKDKRSVYLGYIAGGVFLVLFYFFLLKDFTMIPITRYLGTLIIFILVFFYAIKLKNDKNYESYVINVLSGAFITAIYSAVLYLGLAAILLTIDNLFDVAINSKVYFYMFIIVVFIFGISLFLSKIPDRDEDFESYEYVKSLKALLVYIVIPLITVYTLILYAYFIKILVTWVWPTGLVSHLVLWYSVLSVGVIFFITPVLEENRIAKLFKFWFPKFVLPILVMMFMSIIQRINQYGLTENRYYIVLLGIWVLVIMLYFSFKIALKNIIIPISLSLVVLIAVYGPVSSFSISKASQNNRLNRLLEANNMLSDGVIASNPNAADDAQREINNIISYFNNNHSLDDIKVLPDDFELTDTEKIFGFEYAPNIYDGQNEKFFSYFSNPNQNPINIEGYEYYMSISSWNSKEIVIDDIDVKYSTSDHVITINEGGVNIFTQDINILADEIHSKLILRSNDEKSTINIEEMTFDIDDENIKAKFIFTNMNGRYNSDAKSVDLENAEFILLLDIR